MTETEVAKPRKKQRSFTPEFKAEVAAAFREAKANGTPIAEIAKRYNISDVNVHTWGRGKNQKRAKLKKKAKKDHRTNKRQQYSIVTKQKAVAMLASGMSAAEVGRQLDVSSSLVLYWSKHGIIKGAREEPGTGLATIEQPRLVHGALKDALIYLVQAERKLMDMVREGKLSKPDPAHLLMLLALGELQKANAK